MSSQLIDKIEWKNSIDKYTNFKYLLIEQNFLNKNLSKNT